MTTDTYTLRVIAATDLAGRDLDALIDLAASRMTISASPTSLVELVHKLADTTDVKETP